MPAVPGPGRGMQACSGARKARERPVFTSSITAWKAGSRWPTVARAAASRTRWETSDGPGPIRTRSGG